MTTPSTFSTTSYLIENSLHPANYILRICVYIYVLLCHKLLFQMQHMYV